MNAYEQEFAWAAGFIEADGSTGYNKSGGFRIAVSQNGDSCPPQLKRFADLTESNVMGPYGPYETRICRTPQWQVVLQGPRARLVLKLMRQYMTQDGPKLTKALEDLNKCVS